MSTRSLVMRERFFFSPLALACYGDAPEIKQNGVLFYRVSHEVAPDYNHAERFKANEQAIALNGMSRRCDTVVYDKAGTPKVIVEYKRPTVTITQKVFDQISRYNLVLHVDYLIISNGLKHYCVKMEYPTGKYAFLQDIPNYSDL